MDTLLLTLLAFSTIALVVAVGRYVALRRRYTDLEGALTDKSHELATTGARVSEIEKLYADSQRRTEGLHEMLSASRSGHAAATARLEEERNASTEIRGQLTLEKQRADSLGKEVNSLTGRLASAETKLEEMQAATEEKLALLHDAEQQFKDLFASLSSQALKENNDAFLTLAKTQMEKAQAEAGTDLEKRKQEIDRLVKPISESLGKIDVNVRKIEVERAESFQLINSQLQLVKQETGSLSRALRQPTARGQWGEMQLKNVVELAGLQEHCDFHQQTTLATDDGGLRPDMIVNLPDQKTMVIDSKVPLHAYLEAAETDDAAVRATKLTAHLRQTRNHIDQLSKKAYWNHLETSPDFVICFLPNEALYSAAVQEDPALLEYSAKKNVLLVSPTILIAVLKGVAYGWRQQQLAQSAQEISTLGAMLYDRIRVLADHFSGIRKGLDKAVRSYNSAVGSLESRVLVTARQFPELGTDNKQVIESPRRVELTTRPLTALELVQHTEGDGGRLPTITA